jgi:hypothetical protein
VKNQTHLHLVSSDRQGCEELASIDFPAEQQGNSVLFVGDLDLVLNSNVILLQQCYKEYLV